MSVEYGVTIVDWDDFQQRLEENDPWTVLYGEEDEDGEMVEGTGIPGESLSIHSVRAQAKFIDTYHQFSRYWHGESKAHFENIFYTLFWGFVSPRRRVMELEAEDELEGIDTALSPATTLRLAEESRRINWDECRELFEQHVKSGVWFGSWEGFHLFAQEWITILQKAASEDKSVIIDIF